MYKFFIIARWRRKGDPRRGLSAMKSDGWKFTVLMRDYIDGKRSYLLLCNDNIPVTDYGFEPIAVGEVYETVLAHSLL